MEYRYGERKTPSNLMRLENVFEKELRRWLFIFLHRPSLLCSSLSLWLASQTTGDKGIKDSKLMHSKAGTCI